MSSSTRSDLVRAMMPRGMPSRRQMSKCSRVCGLMDSSAAIDEEHQVDAADAGQHVLDEALVAGHVDEAEAEAGRELQVREAEIDGDAAALLLFEAVGVDAGEGFDERGLAVIDVAGGADDDVLHAACYSLKVLALPLLALVAGSLVYCVLTIVAAARYGRWFPRFRKRGRHAGSARSAAATATRILSGSAGAGLPGLSEAGKSRAKVDDLGVFDAHDCAARCTARPSAINRQIRDASRGQNH